MRIWLLAVAIIFVLIQAESDASRAPGDLNGNGKLDFGDFVALSKGIQSSPDLRWPLFRTCLMKSRMHTTGESR